MCSETTVGEIHFSQGVAANRHDLVEGYIVPNCPGKDDHYGESGHYENLSPLPPSIKQPQCQYRSKAGLTKAATPQVVPHMIQSVKLLERANVIVSRSASPEIRADNGRVPQDVWQNRH